MDIDLTLTWGEAVHANLEGRVAVVVDVLRATSTIVAAFQSGAREVIPIGTVEEGFRLAERLGRGNVALGGERGGLRFEGYDLGNSPLEYTPDKVGGKTVVLTTTNGTQALAVAGRAAGLAVAALTNASAVAEWLLEWDEDVTVICAGTEGRLSLDDLYCGGMLISRLLEPGLVRDLSDGARAAMDWFISNAGNAHYVLSSCEHGKRLARLGFTEDLACCARIDVSAEVPVWNGHALVRNTLSPGAPFSRRTTGEEADRV